MPDFKQQLTELIDAFATAKATGNQLLTESAARMLVQFIDGVDITPKPAPEDDGDES
jgi:hypothetical protein